MQCSEDCPGLRLKLTGHRFETSFRRRDERVVHSLVPRPNLCVISLSMPFPRSWEAAPAASSDATADRREDRSLGGGFSPRPRSDVFPFLQILPFSLPITAAALPSRRRYTFLAPGEEMFPNLVDTGLQWPTIRGGVFSQNCAEGGRRDGNRVPAELSEDISCD